MKRGRRLKRVVIGLCVGVVVLVGLLVVAWGTGLILHDSSQAASVKDALRSFRAGKHGTGGLNGVYLYSTEGSESIDALGGATHTYPTTTSITVIEVPCGLQLSWAALEGRSTTWTFCSSRAGIELRLSNERHSFFGQSDHTIYTCSGRVVVPKDVAGQNLYPFRCESHRNVETGEVEIVGRSVLEVGSSRVNAVHARTTLNIHGGDRGNETIDWWLDAANALPLRIDLQSRTSRSMFIGTVHYHEDFSLRLLSLTPKR